MDELPPIRNLSLTQQRIREALKNAKPLTITKRSDDFFVFEKPKKSDENSLLNRFLKHRTTKNCPDNNEPKKTGYKWSQLKDIMTEELETKRMESQKCKEINEKLENEEIDEEITQLETHLNESDDKYNEKDSESNQNDNSSDASDEEKDDGENEEISDEEADEQDMSDEEKEDLDISVEEEESDREANPFVDDEAEDDEEVKDVDKDIERHSDESNDSLVVSNRQKEKPLTQRECNEENVTNDNPLDTSFNIFDESFERKAATQKIALSPFITQKPKPRFDSKNDFSELISDFNLNNDEFNSQSLLDLCSGNFEQNNGRIQKQLESTQNNDSDNEQNDSDSDPEDDPILSRTKKVFNIESDNESDNEDNKTDNRITKEIKNSLKSFNESDGEELIITDDSVGDEDRGEDHIQEEEEEEEDNTLAEHNVNSFFDNEAELSGSDEVSSDEEDVDDEEPQEEEAHEDLPSDEEIEEQNMKYFNKQILDDEKRNIMIWKERLFEDGDLHEDGKQRQRKFRWNFESDDNYVNDYINEDSDDNYTDSDEDQKTKTPTLKMFDKTEVKETIDSKLENRFKLNLKQNFELKNLNKNTSSDAKSGSISSFVVRDRRLNTIMSFESKRSLKSKKNFKSNKKFKASKEKTKKSIFDLLDPNNN